MFKPTLAAAATVLFMQAASGDTGPPSEAPGPLLAELFTSQGCSSCPPAERLFSSLASDPGYVTIEWHVDYWDNLVHGGSRWKDPFSSPAFTERQRAYNTVLRGSRAVYTPQAVLAGAQEFVGSRPTELASARALAEPPTARLVVKAGDLTVSGRGAGEIWFVRLLAEHETNVNSGENKGRVLAGRNIAIASQSLGRWKGEEKTFLIPSLKAGESCALFVQSESAKGGPGAVLGAAYCPRN